MIFVGAVTVGNIINFKFFPYQHNIYIKVWIIRSIKKVHSLFYLTNYIFVLFKQNKKKRKCFFHRARIKSLYE